MWLLVHFVCSTIFHFTLLYSIHFSSSITICFEKQHFCYISVEKLYAEILSGKFFFCFSYVEPKHQSDQHNQNGTKDFQRLIWIFWVYELFPTWCNADCYSPLMFQFDCQQLQLLYPTMVHHAVRNFHHKASKNTFDTVSQSQHLLHTLHKSFCFSVPFLPFLKQ